MAVITVSTDKEFEEQVLQNDKLVLVDFWAAWCPPCRMMAPVLESIANELDEKLDVIKVDVEASVDNQHQAARYGVQGIPNMQLFKGGKVVDELVGYRPEPALRAELKQHLSM